MKILVVGAGGTGGYFGGRLFQSGADITFLVRPARAKNLVEKGLQIESPRGNVTLKVKTVIAENIHESYDLILLSCKAYDLQNAIESIKPAVSSQTFILPILNGLQHLSILEKAFSPKQILGGIVYIAATLGPEGQIRHLNESEKIVFGAREPAQEKICQQFIEVLKKSTLESKWSSHIMQDMWEKFIFLCSLASMTCLMRGSVGQIVATENGAALMSEMLYECTQTSAHSGYPIPVEVRDQILKQLTTEGSTMTASMLRDLQGNARVEADAIVGDMLHRGNAVKVSTPLLQVAFTHLQIYQNQSHSTVI